MLVCFLCLLFCLFLQKVLDLPLQRFVSSFDLLVILIFPVFSVFWGVDQKNYLLPPLLWLQSRLFWVTQLGAFLHSMTQSSVSPASRFLLPVILWRVLLICLSSFVNVCPALTISNCATFPPIYVLLFHLSLCASSPPMISEDRWQESDNGGFSYFSNLWPLMFECN